MGGEYLIELVWRTTAYLGRSFIRRRKLRKGANWLPVRGLVRSVTRDRSVVEVLITYQFEGGYYCDYQKRDLFSTDSAKEYALRFSVESSCVVRLNFTRPQETVLFEEDQPATMPVVAGK